MEETPDTGDTVMEGTPVGDGTPAGDTPLINNNHSVNGNNFQLKGRFSVSASMNFIFGFNWLQFGGEIIIFSDYSRF